MAIRVVFVVNRGFFRHDSRQQDHEIRITTQFVLAFSKKKTKYETFCRGSIYA